MPLSAYDASVAVFARGLGNLKTLLTKGQAHAAAQEMDPGELLEAQLDPSMYTLAVQVHWAAEGAKLAVGRLVGRVTPPAASNAKTFADLHRQLDATIAHLLTFEQGELESGLERTIEIQHRGGTMKLGGAQFLLELAIPGFFFHATTAYGILRHKGVDVTKGDFMGGLG